MMDAQLFTLLKEMRDDIRGDIKELKDSLDEHVAKDETYWKKIDTQDGQIKALKGVGSAIVFIAGVVEWLLRR